MKVKTMERQLWWNSMPQPQEERVQYFFVIINDGREIGTISTRIFEQLAPVDELQERDGKAGHLSYRLMMFFSPKKLEGWQLAKIYRGSQRRDNRLYERQKDGISGLEQYVLREIRNE
jgi:hypothetical protein